ncbi:DUF2169 domain-containing protein [Bartonella sp. HY329]|uniref:DUF2169 family type VI secretion system accessory protein n=1 Tax=unclassified Bartonella TaxID=2645622 RepID=UPI0021C93AF0|nr:MULTISPECIES: DUF2169 domain-containing protein [unclassified Bartonella]UXM96199.1 DUF2169 domain-containing protein [Bartonella sp. HY329]UXN10523.1 DUF2169 domain-containing protein [Bartonella sp. HY328]
MAITLKNFTELPMMRFSNLDNQGREFGIIMVKCAFDYTNDGVFKPSFEQEPFCFTDEFYGELNKTSVKQPSDLVSYKPETDIIINAITYAPNNELASSWEFGFQITDQNGTDFFKKLKAYGPRFWVPKWKKSLNEEEQLDWKDHINYFDGWSLSEAEKIKSVPIRYEYAYGGTIEKIVDDKTIIDAFEYNTVGRGRINKQFTDHTKPVPAPQIEELGQPVVEPYKDYLPAGFGAIPAAWLPRRKFGGTYDQNWVDHVWPNWPKDYDFKFNNTSSSQLKTGNFISYHINLKLLNLSVKGNLEFRIANPIIYTVVTDDMENETYNNVNLDTIICDFLDKDIKKWRIFCVWRFVYNMKNVESISINKSPDWMRPEHLMPSLLPPPTPDQVAEKMEN